MTGSKNEPSQAALVPLAPQHLADDVDSYCFYCAGGRARFLSRFKKLRELTLRSVNFKQCDLHNTILPRLSLLEIDSVYFSPEMFEWIRKQPRLKTIKIWSTDRLDEQSLRPAKSQLPGLELTDMAGDRY